MSAFPCLLRICGSSLAVLIATTAGCFAAEDRELEDEPTPFAQASVAWPESTCRASRLLSVPRQRLVEALGAGLAEVSLSPQVFPLPDGGYSFRYESGASSARGALLGISSEGKVRSTTRFTEPDSPYPGRYGVGLASKDAAGDQVVTLSRAVEPALGVETRTYGPGPRQTSPLAVPGLSTFSPGGRTGYTLTGTSLDARHTVYAYGNITGDLFVGLIGTDGRPVGDTLSLESGFAILCRSIVPTATAGVVSMTDDRQSSQRKWSLIEVDATGALRFEVTHPAPGRDCGPVGLGGHIVTAAWQDRSTNSPIQITRLDRRRPSEPPSVREVSPVNSTAVVKGLVPSGPHTLMISKADTRDGPELPTPIVITRELEGGGKEIVRFDDGPSFEPTMIASDDQSLRFYARRADAIDVYAVTCPDTQATP